MFNKIFSFAGVTRMGCCDCFGFSFGRKPKKLARHNAHMGNHESQELLLSEDIEDVDDCSYNDDVSDTGHGDEGELRSPTKCSEEIIMYRIQHGLICREFPVKETHKLIRSEFALHIIEGGHLKLNPIFVHVLASWLMKTGDKMVNEYVREFKIGSGSYGKVVLYRSSVDGKHYAIKSFHKSYLLKQRVAPCETAMTDVLREVLIMKMLEHPNIVNLIEVIDDPTTDHFYMVLEYVEGKWVCEGSGPPGGLGRKQSTKNIVHGDIKPDNLLVTAAGTVKIGDFSVSQVFEDDNDELRRSPGTPVFTAPECCLGLTYGGKAADTWAMGVSLYCMVFGKYPFLGDTLQDTYDKVLWIACIATFRLCMDFGFVEEKRQGKSESKIQTIVNNPLSVPDRVNPLLKNLLEGLLCKDPRHRMTLGAVSEHAWVVGEEGPIPRYLCWCKRKRLQSDESDGICRDNQAHVEDNTTATTV
ncbi:hypothetical protein HYC85_025285 [Camellia sinensis]|uniref:non-specific serine/threonine protein kinase n=1 Tax=Camellia sinensis TaxID=4442 RepID=A0A7J7GAK9_CAMSI|nr:hypothetical protein HYC85_025285 [Camellia sinensis]